MELGIEDQLGGVVPGARVPMYYHRIKIIVGSEQISTMAAFTWQIQVAGLLGRRGFFDNFSVKFDASSDPPVMEIDRINRA